MRLGIEAGPHTFALAAELGIGGVPIDGGTLVDDGVDATLAPVRERSLSVCQIGAFWFNPLLADAAARERLSRVLDAAPATGCRFVVIGPGNYHPSGFAHYDRRNFSPTAIDELAEALREPVARAEAAEVCLCIEPYLKGVINSAKRFRQLCEQLPSPALRCNVDVTSLYDFSDAVASGPLIRETCLGIGDRCGLLHIKEISVDEGFHLHMGLAPLATGNTKWSTVLALTAPHLADDAWVVLEHISSLEQGRDDHRILTEAAAATGITIT